MGSATGSDLVSARVSAGEASARRATDRPPPSRANEPRPRVAFLGLGAMGKPMAGRLIDEGFPVRVYNRTKTVAKGMTGASAHATPADCARDADVVVTMVSDAAALMSVLEGPSGVLAAFAARTGKPRPILLDMSTIGPRAAIAAAKLVERAGGKLVDAPVSGSVGPASRGDLVALVGGSVRAVERVRPILSALCRKVIHAGGVGQGQTLKVILNGLGAHHFVGFTSMLALGARAGLARDILLDAFTTGAFATPSYVGKRDKVLARDYTADFSLSLALKDCALNVDLQDDLGVSLPVHRAIVAEVQAGIREGLGELDLFALEKHYSRG